MAATGPESFTFLDGLINGQAGTQGATGPAGPLGPTGPRGVTGPTGPVVPVTNLAQGALPAIPTLYAAPIGNPSGTAATYHRHIVPVMGLVYNSPAASTANSAKIQAVINYVKAAGGGVLITLGDFACTVYCDPGLDFTECKGVLIGSAGGFSNTNGVRLLTASTGATDFLIFDSCDNCGTTGLTVTNTSTAYTGKLARAQRGGITLADPSNLRFKESSFFGPAGGATAYGIYLGNANQCHISGCTFEYCGTGVWIAGNQNQISGNCVFIQNRSADIDVQGENNSILNNTFEPAGPTPAEISGGQNGTHARGITNSGVAYGTEITGNWMGDSPKYGSWIRLVGSLGTDITGNTFASDPTNTSEDISLDGCDATLMQANRSINAVNLVKFTTSSGTNRGVILGPNSGTGGYTGVLGTSVIGLQFFDLGASYLDAVVIQRGGITTQAGGGFFAGWGIILNANGVYVGEQTVPPTWGTPAGCGIFPLRASQGTYGLDGIVIAPQQNVAGAEVLLFGYDPSYPTNLQSPVVRFSPTGMLFRNATNRIRGETGAINFDTARITNVTPPATGSDVTTRGYVQTMMAAPGATGPGRTSVPTAPPVMGSYLAGKFERVLFVPTGTNIVFAPTGPNQGDRFGVKNISFTAGSGISVSGNGKVIEQPTGPYQMSPTLFAQGSGPGFSVTWEYNYTGWNVSSLRL